jgi:DNA-directed RNA polymerase specialized sigma24 family protein
MPLRDSRGRPVCADHTAVFHHPLLEVPPAAAAPSESRRRYTELEQRARSLCASCPLFTGCLYEAVAVHDVAGFVAGTTARERNKIRALLGIRLASEDFDAMAGAPMGHRQVDRSEVVRVRRAYPHDSLDQLARRLGCSLSTIKRHLRAARAAQATQATTDRQRTTQPSLARVLRTAAAVRTGVSSRRAVAA